MSSSITEQPRLMEDAAVLKLPGFGLPVDFMPKSLSSSKLKERNLKIKERFVSHSFGEDGNDEDGSNDEILLQSVTTREIAMLRIMDEFTDRPRWEQDIYDEHAIREWRVNTLAVASNRKIITDKCVDYCIEELREKAVEFKEKRYVKVLDSSGCVVKSDNYITTELQENLIKALLVLEGSLKETNRLVYEGDAFEIIDPSLYPVVFGVTKILPRDKIKLGDSIIRIAQGVTMPVPPKVEPDPSLIPDEVSLVYLNTKKHSSCRFQWLPFDVEFENDGNARIRSYINNVHSLEYRNVYLSIEKMVNSSISLWNEILSALNQEPTVRIDESKVDYDKPVKNASGIYEEFMEVDGWKERLNRLSRNFTYPEPEDYVRCKQSSDDKSQVDLRKAFAETGIQVIARVTVIELTPENPMHGGGSWQTDGFTNESICASSFYYYDCENIFDGRLSFRYIDDGIADAMNTNCDCMLPFWDTYGLLYKSGSKATFTQNLGEVSTRDGRVLAFPNAFEHKQLPFKLRDPSKPGQCKVLSLLLVNPERRIISTAHVPPQEREWWTKHAYSYTERLRSLPTELYDGVLGYTNGCPYDLDKAKEYRKQLIQEKASSL